MTISIATTLHTPCAYHTDLLMYTLYAQ